MTDVPNQVSWRKVFQDTETDLKGQVSLLGTQGIVPNPPNASRIAYDGSSSVAVDTTIFSVASGKKFYLTYFFHHAFNNSGAVNSSYFVVTNEFDSIQIYLSYFKRVDQESQLSLDCFRPAIELPAGWKIRYVNGADDVENVYSFYGWLEDV